MASKQLAKGLKRSALTIALGLCFAGGVHAQSSTTGTIYGTAAQQGATVVITNVDTGQTREIQVGSNGRYNASSLPAGRYNVSLQKDGQVLATRENVIVQISAGNEVSFVGSSDAVNLGTVTVVGSNSLSPIDVSQTDSRVVLTAQELQKIPVAQNITSVALLTPGVVAADYRYGNTASFGGSAASENAIYINGYAVTNPLTNLGSTTLPFDAIDQYQSLIGGYGAEFGRATGGVINILTKRGTNEWHYGALATFAPKSLRSDYKDLIFPQNGRATDGSTYRKLSQQEVETVTYGAYASGPIVKDRLFFYAGAEFSDTDASYPGFYNSAPSTNWTQYSSKSPRWIGKLDWNITDNHLLELTAIQDKTKQTDHYYDYDYSTFTHGNTENGGYTHDNGGRLYIAKYTGYLTDNLTVTAMYGKQDQHHIELPAGYDPSQVYISDARGASDTITGLQPYLYLNPPDAADHTKGGRLDVEWLLGNHDIRIGYDRQDSESTAGTAMSGPGYAWIYAHTDTPNDPIPSSGGAAGPGGNGDYVYRYIFANGGTFKVKQEAQYIEDRWSITDNVLLSMGLRNEQFNNYNADGIVYASQRHQLAPRFGLSWDVHGDSSLKLFANAGRYFLAMPNNVALRGAAGSLYTTEYFSYTGVDPTTGVPQGTVALGNGPYSANNEYGQAPDPESVAAAGLKSHYQDEFSVGLEKQFSSFAFGARVVRRELKSAIDDMCDGRPAYEWAIANGYSQSVADNLSANLQNCRLFNPGEANTFKLDDGTGNLVTVPLSAEDLGYPKLKRRYVGLDTYIEHPFDGTWYYRLDYTLSRNYGNAEGQLNSDVGQGDVSQTLIWDHPELMVNSYGYLPNDRRHYLKAHGYWQATPDWRFSAQLSAASGRPITCHGFYQRGGSGGASQDFLDNIEYGPYYHFCDNQPNSRGTYGRLPWTTTMNVGVNWSPAFADHKLKFMVDVFNLFDSQEKQAVYELHESGIADDGSSVTINPRWLLPLNYQTPRYVRFGVRYDF